MRTSRRGNAQLSAPDDEARVDDEENHETTTTSKSSESDESGSNDDDEEEETHQTEDSGRTVRGNATRGMTTLSFNHNELRISDDDEGFGNRSACAYGEEKTSDKLEEKNIR